MIPQWPSARIRRFIIAALAAGILAGCQPAPVQKTVGRPVAAAEKTAKQPFTGNFITSLEPCADQMQDISGPMLLYYLVNKHTLPPKLEDLQQFADVGQELKFTCPVSGKPYVYARAGLQAPGQKIRIYVYDAVPVHTFYNRTSNPWSNPHSYGKPDPADGGSRWCIYNNPDAVNADALFADEIPERAFRQYVQVAPEPTPATAPAPSPASRGP